MPHAPQGWGLCLVYALDTTSTLSDLLQLDAYYLSDGGWPLWVKAADALAVLPNT